MKKSTLYIKGMHCPSCVILISDKLKEIKGVSQVKADFRQQKAEVYHSDKFGEKEVRRFAERIKAFGYQVVNRQELEKESEPFSKRLTEAIAIAIIILIVLYFIREFNLIPQYDISAGLTLSAVFIIGLIASTSTCMATTGALFMATIGKLNRLTDYGLRITDLLPAISFNIGRILSYGFFGFMVGLAGKTVALNFRLISILSALISLAMILIGLDMLKLSPFSSLSLARIGGGLFNKIEKKLLKNPHKTTFFLGAITYFLPCGFTQSVQLYALSLFDPVKSGLIMMVFALATVPALMMIGLMSSLAKNKSWLFVQKTIAVLIVIIGIYYFGNFLSLNGIVLSFLPGERAVVNDFNVKLENGVQVVRMTVDRSGYTPNFFTIKKGVPVKWLIDGKDVYGCQAFFVVPSLGVQRQLKSGENVIEFTPKEAGTINFSCGMGMFRGRIEVIE